MHYDTTTKEDRAKAIEEAKEICRKCNGVKLEVPCECQIGDQQFDTLYEAGFEN